ncbi:MAG: right-handed parallel beta-helix repeat-containing protein [Chloroflexi bacterium]|nr:right-handed parallel beta-helix repeat-containing protein [Chloroflexota bacterium]
MKKTTFKILILITVLSAYYILPTWAQSQGTDKSIPTIPAGIYPQSTLIQQTGNTYSLTNDTGTRFTVTMSGIVFEGNGYSANGINLRDVTNVIIKDFIIASNGSGICIYDSATITVTNNTILSSGNSALGPGNSILLSNSNLVLLQNNNISRAQCGIDLLESNNNIITGNTIETASPWGGYAPAAIMVGLTYGHYMANSSNNLIYNNTILSNTDEALVGEGSGNRWDNGKIGNYWSDYSTKYPNATEIDNSGIGNTPYTIDINNIDRYPIIVPAETLGPTPSIPELSFFAILLLLLLILASIAVLKVNSGKARR